MRIWEDNWQLVAHLPKPATRGEAQSEELKVCELRSHDGTGWNNELLKSLFNTEEVRLIREILASAMGTKSRLIWKH